MADEPTDTGAATAPLGWPLVDRRRRGDSTPPTGVERRTRPAANRLEQLAAANDLLVALHEVAQELPASLDLDDVLDSTVDQVRSLVGGDVITVLLRDPSDDTYVPARGRGSQAGMPLISLPPAVELALASELAVHIDDCSMVRGVADEVQCGLYVAARARDVVVAVVAVESRTPRAFGDESRTVLTALAQPFAVAIDNARLFRRVRSMAADEERRRLARDVHDRIGSSVALLGFELDRIITETGQGKEPLAELKSLRAQITAVVGEVRETLNDLRTDVTDERDLATTLRSFLDRLAARSGLVTHLEVDVAEPLPRQRERELWHMALEALVNVERHSGATTVWVTWRSTTEGAELTIRDDGKGLQSQAVRADSYGLTGMRERATAIGARVSLTGEPEAGTAVAIRVGPGGPVRTTGRTT